MRKVDVRLIVATHRDLAEMCREQVFRQDLYFRLMVLSVELPPLSDRSAELPLMAAGILTTICGRMGTAPKKLTDGAMRVLLDHSWPGNIRELENVLERAVAFSGESQIHVRDLVISNVSLDRRSRSGEQVPISPTSISTEQAGRTLKSDEPKPSSQPPIEVPQTNSPVVPEMTQSLELKEKENQLNDVQPIVERLFSGIDEMMNELRELTGMPLRFDGDE